MGDSGAFDNSGDETLLQREPTHRIGSGSGRGIEHDRVVLEQAFQPEPVEEVLLGELEVGLVPATAAVDSRELVDGSELRSPGRHPQAIIHAEDRIVDNHRGPRRTDPGARAPGERFGECRSHVRGAKVARDIRHPGCGRVPNAAGHGYHLLGVRNLEHPAQPVVGVAQVTTCRRPQRCVCKQVRRIRDRDTAEVGDACDPGPGRLDQVIRGGEGDGPALAPVDRHRVPVGSALREPTQEGGAGANKGQPEVRAMRPHGARFERSQLSALAAWRPGLWTRHGTWRAPDRALSCRSGVGL